MGDVNLSVFLFNSFMITFPNSLVDSLSGSTLKSSDLTKVLGGLGGLENLSSTADITLLAVLVSISDPNLLTPASNAFVPNVLAVFLTNLEVIPFKIVSNIPGPLKASPYSYVPVYSLIFLLIFPLFI